MKQHRPSNSTFLILMLLVSAARQPVPAADKAQTAGTRVMITLDRGQDRGQCFGSLFEASTTAGTFVVGAGFQNAYNTRYRANRHAVQFFIRPTNGRRQVTVEELPRPTDNLTGAYLFERDGTVFSTYGGLQSWNEKTRSWKHVKGSGGTQETMRLGNGTLAFGDSRVRWNNRTILDPPSQGSYQLFFYANGHLCFYHVNRQDRPYRLYTNDEDGFSRLYACPWTPSQKNVDLTQAIVLRLPVVGETTFAWGQLRDQIVTGSNIGGFYVFKDGAWSMLLEPQINVSYQLYSTLAFHDRLLMGQYPTGRVFEYDGKKITDQKGWPPVLKGVSNRAREAQTTAIYGGDLLVGVWPWGEVWRYNRDSRQWMFMQRMFTHPSISADIVHPYEVENRDTAPQNLWGQRVTSLVPSGPSLFLSTSAKAPFEWQPEKYPFLTPNTWKSYGKVYRATMPGHLSATTRWSDGPTKLEFIISDGEMSIRQDGALLASSPLTESLTKQVSKSGSLAAVTWGSGIYGPHGCVSVKGTISNP
ncbi:MAG: hypothetical protein ABGZ17_26775 [Planctomycetaceae bacterium]